MLTCVSGEFYSDGGDSYPFNSTVAFVDNYAGGLGGAMFIEVAALLDVGDVLFKSNEASLGGAVYVLAVEDKHSRFSRCLFESNKAADGGAVYLYTGPGVDIFTASVFLNNFASKSLRTLAYGCLIYRTQSHFNNIVGRAG